jgi:hypothetical protein
VIVELLLLVSDEVIIELLLLVSEEVIIELLLLVSEELIVELLLQVFASSELMFGSPSATGQDSSNTSRASTQILYFLSQSGSVALY